MFSGIRHSRKESLQSSSESVSVSNDSNSPEATKTMTSVLNKYCFNS